MFVSRFHYGLRCVRLNSAAPANTLMTDPLQNVQSKQFYKCNKENAERRNEKKAESVTLTVDRAIGRSMFPLLKSSINIKSK